MIVACDSGGVKSKNCHEAGKRLKSQRSPRTSAECAERT
jgi:hypothetical protein